MIVYTLKNAGKYFSVQLPRDLSRGFLERKTIWALAQSTSKILFDFCCIKPKRIFGVQKAATSIILLLLNRYVIQ